ncbi:MAG: hypothetical protein QM633_08535 [Propionicimonas sp.]
MSLAQSSTHFVVSDALLQVMGTTVAVGQATGVPDVQSRNGSLFASVGEDRQWYLPEFTLAAAPDTAFGFTAAQQGVDANGDPFNVATVTLGVEQREPADVTAFREANPDTQVDPIAFTSLAATLSLTYTNPDGTAANKEVRGALAGTPLTFTGTLLGPDVLLAFSALTATAGASLSVTYSYTVATFQPASTDDGGGGRGRWHERAWEVPWKERRPVPLGVIEPDSPDPVGPEVLRLTPLDRLGVGRVSLRDAAIARAGEPEVPPADVAAMTVAAQPLALARHLPLTRRAVSPVDRLRLSPAVAEVVVAGPVIPEPSGTWVRTVATGTVTLPIADSYGAVSYRPRYLLTAGGTSRVIMTTEDLSEFEHRQSEFVELSALGQISDRYPTLRAIYLGRVSGTVIAIPSRYGLVRTADGIAAACDAVLDPSPASSGCRFHLTFGLAPDVAPADLAGLAQELSQHPEVSALVKRVSVPSRLAPLNPVGLANAGISGLAAANGAEPGAFLVDFDVVDDAVPAIASVNLLMRQLSATPVPTLLGQLSFALDDAFPTPVTSTVVLAFSTTVGEDDLVVVTGEAGEYRLSNAGPVPLRVTSITAQADGGGSTTSAVDVVIPAESAVDGPAVAGTILGVQASLVEPQGGFDKAISDYMRITVIDVQQLRMTVGVNAAGALAGSIVKLDVTASLQGMPGVALPTMTLTPATSIQQIVWQVPLTGGLLGLPADVTVHVTQADGAEFDVTLSHDFAEGPILTLGVEDLKPSS